MSLVLGTAISKRATIISDRRDKFVKRKNASLTEFSLDFECRWFISYLLIRWELKEVKHEQKSIQILGEFFNHASIQNHFVY